MAGNEKPRILAVVGATASGKSALALRLAEELNGEILSCDSMQVYRGMDVGTAKPTPAERERIPHHLIDVASPDEPFSCGDYLTLARQAVGEVLSRGRLPIFCGGTGLYLDRFLSGGLEDTAGDGEVRRQLFAYAAERGVHALHERLAAVDPESALAIHENNVKRVVRALEIYEVTGTPKSEYDRRTRDAESLYDACVIGLDYADREVLYRRIDARVDQMLADGLEAETRSLMRDGTFEKCPTAAQAIGYKELFFYLDGKESLSDAAERLKTATRHYAKRQMTWFRAKPYVRWISMTRDGEARAPEEILSEALDVFRRS